MVSIHLQNHASVIIDIAGVRILCDPWYFDTCFEGGWGLKYQNADALEHVRSCQYLWVSHFHPDHYHVPTLKAILQRNPDIHFIGNRSYNFQLDEAARTIGFTNVTSLSERKPLHLTETLQITRYPVTGTDNMLLIRSPEAVILNYNDCVLPPRTKRRMARKLGPIDVFLNNFNHAGKLLKQPRPADDVLRTMLIANFRGNWEPYHPRWVIPFASHHYYRAAESQDQNSSLLNVTDLAAVSDHIVPLQVGQTMQFDPSSKQVRIDENHDRVSTSAYSTLEHAKSVEIAQLVENGRSYAAKLRKAYPLISRFLPSLFIYLTDHRQSASLKAPAGFRLENRDEAACHISAHSEAIQKWFTKPYGSDSFVVGAHFRINTSKLGALKLYIVCALLIENRLDLRSVFSMLWTASGIRFLWNRREEIAGMLLSRRISAADYQR
ncbi:MAG TPA: MBL fold metallo-hydrolase [Thermoanaerobaculia bacterium]